MGHESSKEEKLYFNFRLEKKIPQDHLLRKLNKLLNLDFLYETLKDRYGYKGNVSVPPPTLMKMMLLLILYNVRSERELMATIPLRLDWLWFFGYDIDSKIPNHSVLSKARKRWGEATFRHVFEEVVLQAVKSGFVDGEKLFVDASLIEANASKNSVKDLDSLHLNEKYLEMEKRLTNRASGDQFRNSKVNKEKIITTDPDATITKNKHLSYKTHRTVDGKHEIITNCETTTGIKNEGQVLEKQIEQHEAITGMKPEIIIADSQYGTNHNLESLKKKGYIPHIRDWSATHKTSGFRNGVFDKSKFEYNKEEDLYICPAGNPLPLRKLDFKKKAKRYRASAGDCNHCPLKDECTRSKSGRTLTRSFDEKFLELAFKDTRSEVCFEDLKLRQHLMERSYANGIRYGYKQARWRGLWRVSIQQLLAATVQNLVKMASLMDGNPLPSAVFAVISRSFRNLCHFFGLLRPEHGSLWIFGYFGLVRNNSNTLSIA